MNKIRKAGSQKAMDIIARELGDGRTFHLPPQSGNRCITYQLPSKIFSNFEKQFDRQLSRSLACWLGISVRYGSLISFLKLFRIRRILSDSPQNAFD